MKQLFLLFLLTSFAPLCGQTVKFDIMAKYKKSSEKSTEESSAYGMSGDDRYFLQIFRNRQEDAIAYVFDLKSKKRHDFTVVTNIDTKGKVNYSFKHIKSIPFTSKPNNNSYYEFESVATDGDIETINLNVYKNKSKKKRIDTYVLKNQKAKSNFFPLFRFICFHLSGTDGAFNYPNGGLILSGKAEMRKVDLTLKSFENADVEITLPE